MTRQDTIARIDLVADPLRNAEDTPPAKVPQNEPRPPMTTASNAYSSSPGPRSGVKVVLDPHEHAAHCDEREGDAHRQRRTRGGCDAHELRDLAGRRRSPGTPSPAVWPRTATASPKVSASATAKMTSGNQPTARSSPRCKLAVRSPPTSSARESAENSSSSTFWMMMDRPKVTSKGGRMSGPSVRFSTPRWST